MFDDDPELVKDRKHAEGAYVMAACMAMALAAMLALAAARIAQAL